MKSLLCTLGLLLLFVSSCTDPITVGSDLLEGDRAGVGQLVDLPFTTRVVRADSLLTYDANSFVTTRRVPAPSPFTFGQIEDADFGRTTHSVYLTPFLPTTAAGATVVPQFVRQPQITIDSIVVLLPIDTARAFYGPGRTFPYRVQQMEARPPLNKNYYSNFDTTVATTDLGFDDRFVGSLEKRLVRDTAIRKDSVEQAHVRIRLNDVVVGQFEALTPATFVDSVFYDLFPGIYLTPSAPSEGLIYLAPAGLSSQSPVYSGFNVYYRDTTGRASEYRIPFLLALPNYNNDYTGSFVETLLDQPPGGGLLAVQGRAGLMTEVRFSDLSALEGKVINRAEMELTVAAVAGIDYTDFPPPARVEFFYRRPADGALIPILDRVALGGRVQDPTVDFFLGGPLRKQGDISFYSPAFSIHLQRMVRGEVPREMYLRVYPAAFFSPILPQPGRVLLNGPGETERPARVRVTFTEVN